MISLIDARLKNRNRWHWLAAVLLASFILLVGSAGYSTAKLESTPAGAHAFAPKLAAVEPPPGRAVLAASDESSSLVASTSTFAPFLDIVPSQDGTELFISAGGVGKLGGTVFANIGIGPGHDKGGWTMTYSNTVQVYVATAAGFAPRVSASGPINITTTLGLDTGTVDFQRAYVPASTTQAIGSIDGNLQLMLVSTDTFPSETYIAVVPSYALPGPLPLGHRLVGSAYSVRASGALPAADKPMSLHLRYEDATLTGADPHTLAIFAWDAYHKRWDDLGGRLSYDEQYLSVATDRFTTYALVTTPAWHDNFDDLSGLDLTQCNNVTIGGTPENRTLVLLNMPGGGSAVSQLITPTTGFANWGSLTFTHTVAPPTTTLTVDVLNLDGSEVLTGVTSGADLTGLDASQYPSLKLRANLSSTVAGETPALERWELAWRVEEHEVYLPMVVK